MSKKSSMSFNDIGSLFKEGLNNARLNPTIYSYEPHEKQKIFHQDLNKGRLYIGGNRSGKTVGGVVEDTWWLLGKHPYRETPPPPVRGRICTVSYSEGVKQIIIPELKKWLPPSALINGSWEDSYNGQDRLLTLANKSTVELMSYDQKLEKFAGTSRHFIHYDEEPPWAIFNECSMRLIDTKGFWWMTMTPVNGMTWVHSKIYTPAKKGEGNIGLITIDTVENPFISPEEANAVLGELDENEQKARGKGEFVPIGGRVFKKFDPERHVLLEPYIPPLDWTHYISLDHGFNNPTCLLWHAVSPKGKIVTYDEIYDNERTIKSYADEIKERCARPGRRMPNLVIADPAIKQRMPNTGDSVQQEYAKHGIYAVLGNNDVKIGVEKINRYFEHDQWFATGECPNFIRELQLVKWKTYTSAKLRHDNNAREEIHKKDDHSTDSARYFISFMPEPYIPDPKENSVDEINRMVRDYLGPTTTDTSGFRIDHNLKRRPDSGYGTEWHTVDETLGGIF